MSAPHEVLWGGDIVPTKAVETGAKAAGTAFRTVRRASARRNFIRRSAGGLPKLTNLAMNPTWTTWTNVASLCRAPRPALTPQTACTM